VSAGDGSDRLLNSSRFPIEMRLDLSNLGIADNLCIRLPLAWGPTEREDLVPVLRVWPVRL
jgi:hypothetical protein